jgi:hypothetical protein
MYRELYAGLPPVRTARDFRRLPVLTAARLRATPLAEQVDTVADTLRTFTPYALRAYAAPAAIPVDQGDTDAIFEQCRAAFARVGVRTGTRALLLTAPEQRYVAAEMAELLGYFVVEAHVAVALSPDAIMRTATALLPDLIVGVGTDGTPDLRPHVTVRSPHSPGADLYVVPEAGIVAVRGAGECGYLPLSRHHYVEALGDGGLLLTVLGRYHRPLIRFELPDRGRITGGRLWLDEVAP